MRTVKDLLVPSLREKASDPLLLKPLLEIQNPTPRKRERQDLG